ncbi:DMT family transporter [Streptomyces cinnamoneus]|uniref:DMT family transporter n=1 Tax=Streptomyces cinnamoneus TaxID=53446 RepID=UPI0034270EF0
MSALVASVLLCLVSAVCYAGAAIVQERIAATSGEGAYAPLRRAGWWAAVALTGLGAGLHVVALACGPLSLVQPLGALTIVFALPMAAWFVHRPVGAAGWRGAFLATAGLAGLLSLTGSPGEDSLDGTERPVIAAAVLGGVALLAVAARWVRRPVVRGVVLATAAGAAFGMGSVFTKAVADDWTAHDADLVSLLPSLGVIALLASAGMLLSQASYRGAGLAAPLATLTVVNPVVAAAVGVVALGEAFRYGLAGGLLAGAAGAVAAAGVVVLTLQNAARQHAVEQTTAGAVDERADVMNAPGTDAVRTPAADDVATPVVPGARRPGSCLVSTRSGPKSG